MNLDGHRKMYRVSSQSFIKTSKLVDMQNGTEDTSGEESRM